MVKQNGDTDHPGFSVILSRQTQTDKVRWKHNVLDRGKK